MSNSSRLAAANHAAAECEQDSPECAECQGERELICSRCGGTGDAGGWSDARRYICRECRGSGVVPCPDCRPSRGEEE